MGSKPDLTLLRVLSQARPIGWIGPRAAARIRASLKHQDPSEFWLAPRAGMVFVVARENERRAVATCYRLQGKRGRDWVYLDRPISKTALGHGHNGQQEERG